MIIKLLKKPWSVVLSFIPFVNIIYLVFLMLISNHSAKIYLWAIPVTLFPSGIILHFLPENIKLFGFYLFIVSLSLILFFNRDIPASVHEIKRSRFLLLIIPLALVGIFLSMLSNGNQDSKDLVAKALDAIVSQNQEKWTEMTHPACDKSIISVLEINNQLTGGGEQQGTISDLQLKSFHVNTVNEISRRQLTASFLYNGQQKLISIEYLKNLDGEGITVCLIEDIAR